MVRSQTKWIFFRGWEINTSLKSETLEEKINETAKKAWQAFWGVVDGFLRNKKDPNYKDLAENLIKSFQNQGCRMSIKLHFLCWHQNFFQGNLGDISEEYGKRLHQDIERMERQYKGRWDSAMMAGYIWSLIWQNKSGHKRTVHSALHFWMTLYYLKKLWCVNLQAFFFMNHF